MRSANCDTRIRLAVSAVGLHANLEGEEDARVVVLEQAVPLGFIMSGWRAVFFLFFFCLGDAFFNQSSRNGRRAVLGSSIHF